MNFHRKILLFGLPMIAALGATSATANAQFSFSAGVNYFVGTQPSGVAAGDFNGDTLPDLAVAADAANNNDVAILLNIGGGAFVAPFHINLGSGTSPEAVVAGDLDGDDDIDLAVGLKGPNQVRVLLNGGSANFALGSLSPTGLEPRGIDIADVDGDTDLDLVVAHREGNTATFLRNNGNATFVTTTLAAGAEPRDAGFGDFDNDNDQDIAVSSHDDRTVRVFANNGAGVFSASATLSVGGNDRPEGLDTGDLNADGRDDIAAASGDDEATGQNRVVVFRANSASSFVGPTYVQTGPVLDTGNVVVADLDCDGDNDLAASNELTNNVSLMANNGAGAFGPPTVMAAGANPDEIIAPDLDNDGDNDLVTSNRNSSNITVFLSQCATSQPVCGNSICEAGENSTTCPGDCPPASVCGNGVCEFGESNANCPGDCPVGPPGSFTLAAANLFVGQQPSATASGDFDGDGDIDLAVTADQNVNNDALAILLGNGNGTFAAPFYVFLPNSSSPEDVVAGDLDGDKDIDLAVGLKDNNQVIAVINGGSANFALGATAPTGAEPRGMDIADVDGDGDLDLAVANREGNTATLLRNNGNATFVSTTLTPGLEPRDAEFGDFDGDGDQDLAVSNHDSGTVSIFANTGGTFAVTSTLITAGQNPEGVATGDVNGDGRDDVVSAVGDDVVGGQNGIVVHRSIGTGPIAFSGGSLHPTGPGALDTSDVTLADMDCDGDLDAATANMTSNNVSVLANSGTGVFGAAMLFAAGSGPDHIIADDLDADGDPDLVAANRNSSNVTVLINGTCEPALAGDVDGDGDVDIDDLFAVIATWGACSGCPADLDDDGDVDIDDLFLVIANWTV